MTVMFEFNCYDYYLRVKLKDSIDSSSAVKLEDSGHGRRIQAQKQYYSSSAVKLEDSSHG